MRYPDHAELSAATKTGEVKTLLDEWADQSRTHGEQLDRLLTELDGGVQGQFLTKASDDPYDFAWSDPNISQMQILPRPNISGTNRIVVGTDVTYTLTNISDLAQAITWSIDGDPEIISGALTGSLTPSITVRWNDAGTYTVKARVNGDGVTLNNSAYTEAITVSVQLPSPGNDEFTVFLLRSDSADGAVHMIDGSMNGRDGAQHPIENKGLRHTKEYSYFGKSSVKCTGLGYLQVPGHPDFLFTGDFSIDTMVRMTATAAYAALFSTAHPGSAMRGVFCYLTHATQNGNKVTVGVISESGQSYIIRTNVTLNLNETYHIEITRHNGVLTCYINGQNAGSVDTHNVTIPGDALIIGADGTLDNNGSPLTGYIEEFRVTKGIARHTAAGFGLPVSVYGPDHVTHGNDAFTKLLLHFNGVAGSSLIADMSAGGRNGVRQAVNNYGVVVDNTMSVAGKTVTPALGDGMGIFEGGYLAIPTHNDFAFGREWSVDFFLATDVTYGTVAAQWRTEGGADRNFDISVSGGVLSVYVNINDANRGVVTPTAINDGVRRHFAITCCENMLRLFVNGEMVASTSAPGVGNFSGVDVCIGLFNASEGNALHGTIDEFRLSNGHARYLSNFPVPVQEYTTAD